MSVRAQRKMTFIPFVYPVRNVPTVIAHLNASKFVFWFDTGAYSDSFFEGVRRGSAAPQNAEFTTRLQLGPLTLQKATFYSASHWGLGLPIYRHFGSMLITRRGVWFNYKPFGLPACSRYHYQWWLGSGKHWFLPRFPVSIDGQIKYLPFDSGNSSMLFERVPYLRSGMKLVPITLYERLTNVFEEHKAASISVVLPRNAGTPYKLSRQFQSTIVYYGLFYNWLGNKIVNDDDETLGWPVIQSIGDIYINFKTQQECFMVRRHGRLYVAQP